MKGKSAFLASLWPAAAVFLIGLCALSGCATIEPVTAGRTIRGLPADRVTVIVPNAVVGRQQDVRLDMPATACTPLLANDKGVFFKAEKPVFIRSWVYIQPRLIDAGVFVPDDPSQPCKPFYVYQGRPVLMHKTDQPTSVTLVDAATRRKVVLRME